MSTIQRTILILFLLALLTVVCRGVVPPFTGVTFVWSRAPSHGTNVQFILQWGHSTNDYSNWIPVGTNTTCTVTNPTPTTLYFRVVAALISPPSNIVEVPEIRPNPIELRAVPAFRSIDVEFLDAGTWKHLVTVSNDHQSVVSKRQNLILRSKVKPPLPQ